MPKNVSRSVPTWFALFVLGLGMMTAAGCAPSFDDASCSSDDECFTDEVCRDGTCQLIPRDRNDTGQTDAGPGAGEVAALVVTPRTVEVAVERTVALEATVLDGAGEAVEDAEVEWASGDESVATVDETGTVTGQATGTVTVEATIGEFTATAEVTVVGVPVASVEVSPFTDTIQVSDTLQLEATPRSADGDALEGRAVEWTSADESVATVDDDGRVSPQELGRVRIEATAEGVTGAARLEIVEQQIGGVEIRPANAALEIEETRQLEAMPLDSDGMDLCSEAPCGRNVTWTSGAPSILEVDTDGLVKGVGTGRGRLYAEIAGIRASVEIAVGMPEVQSVEVSTKSTELHVGEVTLVEASVTDDSGQAVETVPVTWSSDDTTVATVKQGVVRAKGLGTTTITAEAGGETDDVTVDVVAGPPREVEMVPSTPTVEAGKSVSFSPTLKDANGKAISGRSWTWYVTDSSVATITESGELTGQSGGTVTVVAIDQGTGLAGTTEVTVPNRPPTADAGSNRTVNVGETVTLDASQSTDPDGLDGLSYQWSITKKPGQSGATLTDPSTAAPTFVPDERGDYVVELTVDDGMATDTDTVTITANGVPSAKITAERTIKIGQTTMLDGSGSTDPEGKSLSFRWEFAPNGRPVNSTASLSGATTDQASFTPDESGDYTVKLTVTDPTMATDATTATLTATDNLAPEARLVGSTSRSVQLQGGTATVSLDGTASFDPDGHTPLSYNWVVTDKPTNTSPTLSASSSGQTDVTFSNTGTFEITLGVTDAKGKTSTVVVTVTVS